MKKIAFIFSVLFICFQLNVQAQWFTTYSDSTALKTDAEKIVSQFRKEVQTINPLLKPADWKVVKNTSPYLIYIYQSTVNLPFWEEVIPQQKDFFTEVAGGKKQGKEVFGLFFNGFYLVHELGHGLVNNIEKKFGNQYDSEYDANTIAILYWRSAGQKATLKKCYAYAKKMLKHLKNPVPANEDFKEYMSKHYEELSSDPYKYGYIQFSQFVEIYENKKLPDFKTLMRNYQQ
jgi:hypothetical protein